jgi:hypothetical protein
MAEIKKTNIKILETRKESYLQCKNTGKSGGGCKTLKSVKKENPDAVFLVMCDPSVNEL